MKRKPKLPFTIPGEQKIKVWIEPFFPLFEWKKCIICKLEFRREIGWAIPCYTFYGITKYICRECAETKEDVEKLLKQQHFIFDPKITPPAPPKPPSKRICVDGIETFNTEEEYFEWKNQSFSKKFIDWFKC